jgi:glucokinase
MTGCALGIDGGGTKIAVGIVQFPEAKVLTCEIRPTLPERGGEAILDEVVNIARAMSAKTPVQAVGLAICELVDLAGNIVSNNCIHWTTAAVMKRLSAIAPVTIEGDVRAAALAEAHFGAGKPFKIFLYITIGTGISSCLVIDGKPYAGARGLTGTFASASLPGLTQSLEDLASGTALARRAAVPAAATSGAEALGAGIGLLINTLDPQAVIIGGGLGLSGGAYWDTLISSTRRHIWSPLHRDLPILSASSANSALIGAAAAALSHLTRH